VRDGRRQELLARCPRCSGRACACIRRRASAAASRRRPRWSARTRCRAPRREDQALVARGDDARARGLSSTVAATGGGGYALLRQCIGGSATVDDVIETLEASGLRGLGGAGFPAGRKWRIVRSEPAPRLMAVNIDEGEPGTFKDRVYLERDPHRFLEGMLIAAWAVGIERIYIYLRDEYHGCRAMLEAELAKLQARPPSPAAEIELRRGAGAYICGEESAMIESIEGKRGMPRLRPPYVAQVGLFGRPTLEHNFETLYWVRELLEKGAEWFARRAATAARACARSRCRAA
jgi:formate dehydrogenase